MFRIVAFILSIAWASSAFAQTGSRIQNTRAVEAPVAGQRFADCLAEFSQANSAAYLETEPGSPEAEAAAERLAPFDQHRCVQFSGLEIGGRTLYLDGGLMRGQLSQAFYMDEFASTPPAVIAEAQAQEIPVEVYNHRVSNAVNPQLELLRIFGDCVAAAKPMEVDALIRTPVASDRESAAIGALSDQFGPCLWNGQSIQFSRESLRAALADALYRKAHGRTVIALDGALADAGTASTAEISE